MKRFYYLAAALLVIAGATSCKKNGDVKDEQSQPAAEKMVPFKLTAGQGALKTSLVGGNLVWCEGDVMGLKPEGHQESQLTLSKGAGEATGEFTGEIAEGATTGTALYAWTGGTWDSGNNKVKVNVPASQKYVESGIEQGIFPSVGSGTKSDDTNITLSNPLGVLRLDVKGIGSLTGLKVIANSEDINVTGDYLVDPSTGVVTGGGSGKEITMTDMPTGSSAIGLNMSTASKLYFMLPPTNFAVDKLKIEMSVLKQKEVGSDALVSKTYYIVSTEAVSVTASNATHYAVCDPCGAVIPDYTDGTVTDKCGNTYKTVKIGTQVWMAENLKCNLYDTNSDAEASIKSSAIPSPETWEGLTPFYFDGTANGYGYYYNWAAAVGVADGWTQQSAFSGNRQGVCPDGWHMPTTAEWGALKSYIEADGGQSAKRLKSETTDWKDWGYTANTDCYGFAALPAGFSDGNGGTEYTYSNAIFWTATPVADANENAWYIDMSNWENTWAERDKPKFNGRPVRCLKN